MLSLVQRPQPPSQGDLTIQTIARTAWGEARGQGEEGMQAVINVIMNRAARKVPYFGMNPMAVCKKPSQFSCQMPSDVNFAKLQAVNDNDPQFAIALRLARLAVAGDLPDLTSGSTFYFAKGIKPPYWAAKMTFVTEIGDQLFYRDGA